MYDVTILALIVSFHDGNKVEMRNLFNN